MNKSGNYSLTLPTLGLLLRPLLGLLLLSGFSERVVHCRCRSTFFSFFFGLTFGAGFAAGFDATRRAFFFFERFESVLCASSCGGLFGAGAGAGSAVRRGFVEGCVTLPPRSLLGGGDFGVGTFRHCVRGSPAS